MHSRIVTRLASLDRNLKESCGGNRFDYFQNRILVVMTGLSTLITFACGTAFFLLPESVITSDTGHLFSPLLFCLSFVFALSFMWLLSGRIVLAKTLIAVASLVAIIGSLAITGGFPASRVSFIVLLPPIFFYCVYGARPGLIISLLLPVIVAGMWLAHDRFGIAFPDHFSYINTDLSMTLAIAPVYLVVVFIVAVYESANRKLSHLLDAERTHHARLAFLDPLTNLDNSRAFVDRLNSAASPHNGQTSPIAVICCDIDDLKPINDTFGHANGDQVLIAVGERLKSAVRSQFDLVARVGGDEFAILLPSCPETEIDSVIHRIRARMSEPLIINDQTITIQVSIGAATGLPGETDPFEIVKRADAAMYRNKAASKQSRLALGEERANP